MAIIKGQIDRMESAMMKLFELPALKAVAEKPVKKSRESARFTDSVHETKGPRHGTQTAGTRDRTPVPRHGSMDRDRGPSPRI